MVAAGADEATFGGVAEGLGRMFYVVDPAKTSFESPEDVPNFYRNVSDWRLFMLAYRVFGLSKHECVNWIIRRDGLGVLIVSRVG